MTSSDPVNPDSDCESNEMWNAEKWIAKTILYVIVNVLATICKRIGSTGNAGQICCKLGFGVTNFAVSEQWKEHRRI